MIKKIFNTIKDFIDIYKQASEVRKKARLITGELGNSNYYIDNKITIHLIHSIHGNSYSVIIRLKKEDIRNDVFDVSGGDIFSIKTFRKGLWLDYLDQLYSKAMQEIDRRNSYIKKETDQRFEDIDDRSVFQEGLSL